MKARTDEEIFTLASRLIPEGYRVLCFERTRSQVRIETQCLNPSHPSSMSYLCDLQKGKGACRMCASSPLRSRSREDPLGYGTRGCSFYSYVLDDQIKFGVSFNHPMSRRHPGSLVIHATGTVLQCTEAEFEAKTALPMVRSVDESRFKNWTEVCWLAEDSLLKLGEIIDRWGLVLLAP